MVLWISIERKRGVERKELSCHMIYASQLNVNPCHNITVTSQHRNNMNVVRYYTL